MLQMVTESSALLNNVLERFCLKYAQNKTVDLVVGYRRYLYHPPLNWPLKLNFGLSFIYVISFAMYAGACDEYVEAHINDVGTTCSLLLLFDIIDETLLIICMSRRSLIGHNQKRGH